MKTKRWKVLEVGPDAPELTRDVSYCCMNCMEESELGVSGVPIAQNETTIFFDLGKHWMPKVIRCPYCRCTYERVDTRELR